jgi:hypothetical protein
MFSLQGRYLINSDAHELAQLDFEELTADVEQAWSFVQERKTSRPLVRLDQSERRELGPRDTDYYASGSVR